MDSVLKSEDMPAKRYVLWAVKEWDKAKSHTGFTKESRKRFFLGEDRE